MNATVAAMLGEANFHSPEEKAQLAKYAKQGAGPSETDTESAEESQEVKLAQQILAAVKSGDKQTIIQAASELIRMHDPNTAASYERETTKLKSSQSGPFGMMRSRITNGFRQ